MELLVLLLVLAIPTVAVGGVVLAVVKPETRDRLRSGWRALSRSLPGRLALVFATGVALLIPLQLVEELREERGHRLTEVEHEMASQWGGSQSVLGPVLWLPVVDTWNERVEKTDADGNVKVHVLPRTARRTYVVLPEALAVTGDLDPSKLRRGLYDVLVYDARVSLTAQFRRPELQAPTGHELEPLWSEAQLLVELSDLSAVSSVDELRWQDVDMRPNSGVLATQGRGIRGAIPSFDGATADATVRLRLRGMGSLSVAALGEQSDVTLAGAWDAPSFGGFTLPVEREVGSDAFTGRWSVIGVSRPLPQIIELGAEGSIDPLRRHTVGVTLVEPASPYASTERAITYGLLVIGLCLLTFLLLEHGMQLQLHPVQWLVNGLALVVFYLILLATSEHSGFHVAYGAASAVTIAMVGAYTWVATRSVKVAGAVLGSLSVLYAAMYGMLRSEDHSLLMGTGLVVAALAGVMWVTRSLGHDGGDPPEGAVSEPFVA